MKSVATGMADIVNSLRPSVSNDMPVDLDQIAKAGRRAVFLAERRRATNKSGRMGIQEYIDRQTALAKIKQKYGTGSGSKSGKGNLPDFVGAEKIAESWDMDDDSKKAFHNGR